MTTPKNKNDRRLYHGDNLGLMREQIKDESVDLVYLDPPFNSGQDYNIPFKDQKGEKDAAQIKAFEDTWHWGDDDEGILATLPAQHPELGRWLKLTVELLGKNDMSAYLTMMAVRLLEIHRSLKPSGSMYLHCDVTASHYLKAMCDIIFGDANFMNEIVWKGADAHNDARYRYAAVNDRILFYAKKREGYYFEPQHTEFPVKTLREWYLYLELPDGTTRRMTRAEIDSQEIPDGARRFNTDNLRSPSPRPNLTYDYKGYKPHPNGWAVSMERMKELDEAGLLLFPRSKDGRIMRKKYLDESKGPVMSDTWTDISQLRGHDIERLGYPTQKPVALLERIIKASCPESGIVMDPFCGCGTAVVAAEALSRHWIGMDITHLAVGLIKSRLKRDFALGKGDFLEDGVPTTIEAAQYLFDLDPYDFQYWTLGEIGARPYGASSGSKKGKKGGDGGIDGELFFMRPDGQDVERAIVSVKGGKNLTAGMVRDLVGTMTKHSAAMGIFICLAKPTAGVLKEATLAGVYEYGGKTYPKVQIMTVEDILAGKQPQVPEGSINVTHVNKKVTSRSKQQESSTMKTLF
ncbi:site-specific DNA-methyltransferase [Deinococcus fonticola]|uniref:site-specific DNA-methyltransferase n=1 Tax=Deinococcus fonticola TaxID=2528713 RepID=UPI0010757462|nr:DNA methyltransferase [Deinococcus fonticola]